MKKIASLILIVLMTSIVLDTTAQNAGIKFGSVWSKANLKADESDELPDQKFLISPQVGVIFEAKIYEGLFLQTGLMASLNGYRYEADFRTVKDENDNDVPVESIERPILLYMSLPVNFGYKHMTSDKFGIFGMVGPVFRYLAYSTWSYKVSGEWDNEATNEEIDGEEKSIFKSFDFALNIEAGVQYDRFKFSLYYAPSFSNIHNDELLPDDSDDHWKNYSKQDRQEIRRCGRYCV